MHDTEKTKVIRRDDIKGAAKDTVIVSKHKWIDENDEPVIKPVGRNTIVGRDSNTRIYEKPAGIPSGAEKSSGKRSFGEVMNGIAGSFRGVYSDLRNVRVGDSARFARFLKVIGAFALILLLELGYFSFAHRTAGMPDEIKETQKELELTQKETAILQEEIDELGDYDSIEEQRQSWERLKEKVEKAAGETSY